MCVCVRTHVYTIEINVIVPECKSFAMSGQLDVPSMGDRIAKLRSICGLYHALSLTIPTERSEELTQAAQHQENETHGSPYITKLRSVSGMRAGMQSHKAAQCLYSMISHRAKLRSVSAACHHTPKLRNVWCCKRGNLLQASLLSDIW